MKIQISIPCNRQIKPKTVLSLLELVSRGGFEFSTCIASEGYTISENRTYCVLTAIKAQVDYILFIDDDMIFPENTLETLMKHKKEIVGVASYSRCLPLVSTVLHDNDEMPETLFEAIQVGGGILLIDIGVFGRIQKPWFTTTVNDMGQTTMGEDAHFCEQAYRAGIKVYCDPLVPVGHIGSNYAY